MFLALAAVTLVTWEAVRQPEVQPETAVVMEMQPPAAPPEPVHDVPDGPMQVEQAKQKPVEAARPNIPIVLIKQETTQPPDKPQQEEAPSPLPPIPETTVPKSLPAPPARSASSNAEPSWQARLLAHLEKHRRYPAAARARGDQGVVHVRFRMSRQGKVLDAQITRRSGIAALDRAALATLRRAEPLPLIPDNIDAPLDLTVPVEFFLR